jgi:3',5'-cyclic-AMP phosphodiesterase
MVCHLDRRAFLATLAGLILPIRQMLADTSEQPEIKFLITSDTHLGYNDSNGAERQWEKTATELKQRKGAFVLHLGDVVDGGREAQYPNYLTTRQTIGKPVHEIPGNHDPHELFAKHVRSPIDTVVDHAWLRIVLLGNAHTDSHDGFLTPEQLGWLDRQLQDGRRQQRAAIVAMHVPAHTNQHPDRGWYVKPKHGQAELYEIVTAAKSPAIALFHGHFHNGLRGWDDHRRAETTPVWELCFPSALYNQDRKLEAQKAPGFNPDEFRPGYVAATLTADSLNFDYVPTAAEGTVSKTCAVQPA